MASYQSEAYSDNTSIRMSNCHETHYCIEVPKAHMSTEQLEISRIQHNN